MLFNVLCFTQMIANDVFQMQFFISSYTLGQEQFLIFHNILN